MRALVLLHGELHTEAWGVAPELAGPWDYVICADGGGRYALRLGVVPDLLLGDFDSLSPLDRQAIRPRSVVEYPPAKDKTDAQLAVEEALRHGAGEIVLAGALGGRLDHTLANLGLLRFIHRFGARGIATDGRQAVHFVCNGDLHLTGISGQVLSLLPLTTQVYGVSLQGVRWRLSNARLEIGDTRTVSNEFLGGPAYVNVESGELLVIVQLPT